MYIPEEMVRTTKKTDSIENVVIEKTATASTTTPIKKEVSKKAKKEVVSTPVVDVPMVQTATQSDVAVEPVVVEPVVIDPESLSAKLNVFGAKLQQLAGLFSSVKTDFKTLEKTVLRDVKVMQKLSSRRKKSAGNRQPSGFVKPTRISDELASFLGKSAGIEMARTDVSKEINAYIRSNGLQDKDNGRKINADPKLSTLLRLNKEDELTYFNLQRYMKPHFIKAEVVVPASVATA